MILDKNIPDLVEHLDLNGLRVRAPTSTIFLCGGLVNMTASKPISLRDAFLRVNHNPPLSKYRSLLAEEANVFFPEGNYKDLLKFESDIAQVAELVILFSESAGSIAELGAFACIPEISQRLLVVVDDHNFNQKSFVKLGPLLSLENKYGNQSIYVVNRGYLGFSSILDVSGLKLSEFAAEISGAISTRLEVAQVPTRFDEGRGGHIIKLITGLIQFYGAVRFDEIRDMLLRMGLSISDEDIGNYLLCSCIMDWVDKTRSGFIDYYSARASRAALTIKLKDSSPRIDRERWNSDIRDYWRSKQPDRFRLIQASAGRAVK